MKWIKTRKTFLTEEAKIKDVILPRQAKEVTRVWGEKWLDLETIEPTENIKQNGNYPMKIKLKFLEYFSKLIYQTLCSFLMDYQINYVKL